MPRNGDSYHPRRRDNGPPLPPPQVRDAMYRFGAGGKSQTKSDFTFRHRQAPRVHERDLLTHVPSTNELSMLGTNHVDNRFKDFNDVSVSDASETDQSSESKSNNRTKRPRLENLSKDGPPTPKWSNPDPYTALPPPEESTRKGVDMVKFIRKARNEDLKQDATSAEQNDFISFDFPDDPDFGPPPDAPTGPKAGAASLASRIDTSGQNTPLSENPRTTLGKRKRADKLDRNAMRQRVERAGGIVLDEWTQTSASSRTPWLRSVETTKIPIVALHKEILDFYNWVKPQDHEFSVRQGVIDRLSKELNRRELGQLEAFGSYAAGLFLPVGDMDLVYNHRRWNGQEFAVAKNMIYRYRDFLERTGIAEQGTLQPIAHAKVPIIKFVDAITGLRVDLSFNSKTGTRAVTTFQKWKEAHPAMPIIVSVIKQMLMIRGLNDVATGGIGGFSIICLVTSLLQHLPAHKAANLGEVLVEFLNLYGNLFDREVVGVRLDPPSYIDKVEYAYVNTGRSEQANRLMIIDPNQADNNISGGTSSIGTIFHLFSNAHEILQDRLDDYQKDDKGMDFSFLEELVGGNFAAYDAQRRHLHNVYARTVNSAGQLRGS